MIIRNSSKIIKEQQGLTVSIVGADNMAPAQEYDETTGVYYPDWSILPLILLPDIRDSEGVAVDAADVSSKGWYSINADGSFSQIVSTTPGFELYPSGYPLGLKVKKNISPGQALGVVFRFAADGFAGMATETLRADNNPAPTPDLELDFPAASVWNPFTTDRDVIKVTPYIRDFGHAALTVEWMKFEGNAWRDIDPSDPKDAELELDAQSNALSVNRRWMGESVSLMCRLIDNSGSTPVVLRECPVTMRRRIPDFTAELLMSSVFTASDTKVMGEASIKVGTVRLSDPSMELQLTWYDGSTSVGTGNKWYYPTKGVDAINAAYDVKDRGPMKLLTLGGKYLTLGGKLIGGR